MSTKIFFIALISFLGLAEFSNAGVLLYVQFGDEDPDENNLVSVFKPDSGSTSLTANIYLHLTPRTDWAAPARTSIYGYRFSVLYDSSLKLTGYTQFTPAGFDRSEPVHNLNNSNLLQGFNAVLDTGNFMEAGFFRVATLTFSFNFADLPQAPSQLVKAGKFADPDVLLEGIDTEDFVDPNLPDDKVMYGFQQFGGVVQGGSTVPEPSSLFVLGGLGLLAITRRKILAK